MKRYTLLLSASLAALGLTPATSVLADPVTIDPLANAQVQPAASANKVQNFNLTAPSVDTSAPHSLLVLQVVEQLDWAIEEGDQEYISKLSKKLANALELEAAGTPGAPITGDNGQLALGMFWNGQIPANAFATGPGAPPANESPDGAPGTGGDGSGGVPDDGGGGTTSKDPHVATAPTGGDGGSTGGDGGSTGGDGGSTGGDGGSTGGDGGSTGGDGGSTGGDGGSTGGDGGSTGGDGGSTGGDGGSAGGTKDGHTL